MGSGRLVLLVGEGNFSFAASLCHWLPSDTRMVATCYESQEAAFRQEGAAANIEYLLRKGAEVHFLVNCTSLQECPSVGSRQFDQIVFNFPHCGRKAGVKKNRELLAKFFLSCTHVLTAGGEVHVTLCKGQGGTDADRPPRRWHDSWQVTAMAAGANLILTGVRPFDGASHAGYTSTGYKSQDKAFRLEGALTHVFARSLPITRPKPVTMETEVGGERCSFTVPEELTDMIDRGFLRNGSPHPVKVIKDRLLKLLAAEVPVRELEDQFPILCRSGSGDSLPGFAVPESEVYFVSPSDRSPGSGGPLCLRPSLALHLPELLLLPPGRPDPGSGALLALSGVVFRRCRVSPLEMPAFHQLLLAASVAPPAGGSRRTASALETALGGALGGGEGPCRRVTLEEEGEGWVVRLRGGGPGSLALVREGPRLCLAAVHLDRLALAAVRLDDWRLLWADPAPLPRSLHPPSYRHDVSFWAGEGEGEGPAELDVHVLVRRVSGGTAESVELVDRYRDPRTGRTGYCYRLIYRSGLRALSSQLAARMQLELREELRRGFLVTLR